MRTVVASAGSSGSAYLLAGAGKAPVFAAGLILPEALAPVVHARVGEAPGEERSTAQINAWAVDALLRVGIDSLDSDIAFLWLTDPDHSVHGAGLGSAIADSVIRGVDRDIARLLQELDTRGLRELVDILVVSDHGFSTHAGVGAPFTRVLAPFREHVVMAGSAVYLRAGSEHMRGQVVTALQSAAEVGAVFTAGQAQGGHGDVATGTLPLSSVSWAHARAGDILFSANWSHAPNAKGIAGWSAQGGVAGHGTTSPYDVGATFIAAGPHIRRGITSRVPSGNVDVAPTLLTLLGVPVPPHMQGRALTEILREGPEPGSVAVRREQEHAEATLGGDSSLRYRVTLFSSTVGTTRYMDSTTTTREPVRVPE
jgi:hypothetical protein